LTAAAKELGVTMTELTDLMSSCNIRAMSNGLTEGQIERLRNQKQHWLSVQKAQPSTATAPVQKAQPSTAAAPVQKTQPPAVATPAKAAFSRRTAKEILSACFREIALRWLERLAGFVLRQKLMFCTQEQASL